MERSEAAHLLRRAGFGGTASTVDEYAALSRDDAVTRLLDRSSATGIGPKPDVLPNDDGKYDQFVTMFHDWFGRMAYTGAPLVEKMTLFWHNHFTTSLEKTYAPRLIHAQHTLYWNNALGNFRTLAQAMAVEPAMLDYLDNRYSNKYGPNQNFARELMELFVLGVGNYSEDDVAAASKAWTGHSVADDDDTYEFRADWHDETESTFFGETRVWDGPQIIDKIFDSKPDVVAKFVSKKLWSFFAYPNPEQTLVDSLASTLINSGWEVAPVLRQIFTSDQFFSAQAMQGLVRMPCEYFATVIRGLGVDASVLKPQWYQEGMGQVLWNPPDVSGWKQNNYWVSSATAGGRAELARSAPWLLEQAGVANPLAGLVTLPPAEAVDKALALFVPEVRSAAHRDVLVSWLTDVQSRPEEEWTLVPFLTSLTLMLPELQLA